MDRVYNITYRVYVDSQSLGQLALASKTHQLVYVKALRLKNNAIAYLIVFSESEYGMTNASISSVALPLTATPKWVKRG